MLITTVSSWAKAGIGTERVRSAAENPTAAFFQVARIFILQAAIRRRIRLPQVVFFVQ
jgi:hypothetical protein